MVSLNEEQKTLASKSYRSTMNMTRRYKRQYPQFADDIESSAYWGLIRAAASYDKDRGQAWRKWATQCVHGEMREFLSGKHVSNPPSNLRVEHIEFHYVDRDPTEQIDELRELLKSLPEQHRRVCEFYYRDGMSDREISIKIGLSRSSIQRIHKESLEMLKRKLAS